MSVWEGHNVEVSISYVSNPGTGGAGLFVDETRLVVGGAAR